ncbi:FAD:protein FMN transferase [Dyadobacter luticola]|uniref:FAD:protein FMN transferase n=1 Tax=Dyadobacter luticola TaxID=1979387 RepID=A0A5R9KSS3_9BACT|nr:FAD:protein FMN transferase [Dyadobacter luticola]TLU99321.1 FAD:protein FMN transferase [Dyadobacter luticola]
MKYLALISFFVLLVAGSPISGQSNLGKPDQSGPFPSTKVDGKLPSAAWRGYEPGRFPSALADGKATTSLQSPLTFITGSAQGTTYNAKYYDEKGRNFKTEIDSILADFDKSLSLYRNDSELVKFNRNSSLTFQSPYFYPVLKKSQEVYQATNGAFDPTIMPLAEAYGFGAKRISDPQNVNVDSLLNLVGFQHIQFDSLSVQKLKNNVRLDFNGIAQGYSVDVIGAFLQKQHIDRFMVEIGGEVLSRGMKEEGKSWIASIEDPLHRGAMFATARLENRAMTTAGNYHNHFIRNGQVFNHLINPKTGSMEQTSLLSVTVFAKDAITADGYDTAFFVMGLEATKAFIKKRNDLDVYLIYTNEKGGTETFASDGIRDFIRETNRQ